MELGGGGRHQALPHNMNYRLQQEEASITNLNRKRCTSQVDTIKKTIQMKKRRELIAFIKQFMNQVATHLARGRVPLGLYKMEAFIGRRMKQGC